MDKQQRELIDTYFTKRNKALEKHPEKREKYETKYILSHPKQFDIEALKFSNFDWLDELIKHPELLDEMKFVPGDWRLRYHIAETLRHFPQLFEYMDINNMMISELSEVLKEHPEFIPRIPKEKLGELRSYHIESIVLEHPEYAEYFNINNMDNYAMKKLIIKRPELASTQRETFNTKFDKYDVIGMLEARLDILKYVPEIKDRGDYSEIMGQIIYRDPRRYITIMKDPQMRKSFNINDLPADWVRVIIDKWPKFVKYYVAPVLGGWRTSEILIKHPRLYRHLNLNSLSSDEVFRVIMKRPELARHLKFGYPSHTEYKKLLDAHPELIEILMQHSHVPDEFGGYDVFMLIDEKDIAALIEKHPSLGPYLQQYIDDHRKKWMEYVDRKYKIEKSRQNG